MPGQQRSFAGQQRPDRWGDEATSGEGLRRQPGTPMFDVEDPSEVIEARNECREARPEHFSGTRSERPGAWAGINRGCITRVAASPGGPGPVCLAVEAAGGATTASARWPR